MSFKDIQFLINNERVGDMSFIESQPDLSFFTKIQEYLQGDCRVSFKVGQQLVESNVSLRGNQFFVENNFVEFDIKGFIDEQKERIQKEQVEANFTENLNEFYFLPSTELLNTQILPIFDRSKLIKNPDGTKFFVSHRWLSLNHPDPDGVHLSILKKHAQNHNKAFYWIDYSCLPQSRDNADDQLFQTTLPKIISIQAKSSTIIIPHEDYLERLWCYIELYAGVLFSQTNLANELSSIRDIEYLGTGESLHKQMLNLVQTLNEPEWNKLRVTNKSDIPSIKYNYKFLTNLVKFQLVDRFSELRRSLPGHDIFSGEHYFQSAFGINYSQTLNNLRQLFFEFGGRMDSFYEPNSLLWLAERISWSSHLDKYNSNDLKFSNVLFFSRDMVGWIALLLAIIEFANRKNKRIVNFRELYSRIVLISQFS